MILLIGRRATLTAAITGLDVAGLTGYSARLVISPLEGQPPLLNKAGVITAPLTSVVDFTILPTDLVAVAPGNYKYEVNIWQAADTTFVYTPISGFLEIKPGLTATPTV